MSTQVGNGSDSDGPVEAPLDSRVAALEGRVEEVGGIALRAVGEATRANERISTIEARREQGEEELRDLIREAVRVEFRAQLEEALGEVKAGLLQGVKDLHTASRSFVQRTPNKRSAIDRVRRAPRPRSGKV